MLHAPHGGVCGYGTSPCVYQYKPANWTQVLGTSAPAQQPTPLAMPDTFTFKDVLLHWRTDFGQPCNKVAGPGP